MSLRGEEPGFWERAEGVLVAGVAAHSVGVGLFLALAPSTATTFAGFGAVTPVFFARQAGAFHLVLAAGYVTEYLRTRGVALLLIAKCTAVIFLTAHLIGGAMPWSVPFSAALDGLMGLAVALAHPRAQLARRGRLHVIEADREPGQRACGR